MTRRDNLLSLVPVVVGAVALAWILGLVGGWPLPVMVYAILIMVMVHEFGHFIMAKRAGMLVTDFFVGFGPVLWSITVGETRYGVNLGSIDYSTKTTNAWGETTITERPEVSKMVVPFVVQNRRLDLVMRKLSERRAKPTVWIGVGRFDAGVVYGYPDEKQLLIAYRQVSECSLTIKGLV